MNNSTAESLNPLKVVTGREVRLDIFRREDGSFHFAGVWITGVVDGEYIPIPLRGIGDTEKVCREHAEQLAAICECELIEQTHTVPTPPAPKEAA